MDADYIEIHVDETGDRGFGPKSSPYFCLAACAFRRSDARTVISALQDLNAALGRPREQPIHAVNHLKTHDKLMEAVERLAELPVGVFYVVLPKASTPTDSALRGSEVHVYNYLARLLLERMSWYARDAGIPAQPTFAGVKRMPRKLLDTSISRLRRTETTIAWQWLRLPVKVEQANNRVGMQWADIAGRAMLKATTLGAHPPRRTEPAYLEALAPVIWGRRRVESYGIKSVERGWHSTQPWWDRVTAAIPHRDG